MPMDRRSGLRRDLYYSRCPWVRLLYYARTRCTNENCDAYPYYGGRGIKCLLTPEELGQIWKRDGASNMDWPSLDRIDPDGDYTFDNCRIVEFSQNSSGRRNKRYAIEDWKDKKKRREK